MKYIDVEQGSPEWHELRRTKIGASNSPAILGISPYKTKNDVFNEMAFGEKPFINKAMSRGSLLEEEARTYLNNLNPFHIEDNIFTPAVIVHDTMEFIMASLDGINKSETMILEIKCPGEKVYEQCALGKIPKHCVFTLCNSSSLLAERTSFVVVQFWTISFAIAEITSLFIIYLLNKVVYLNTPSPIPEEAPVIHITLSLKAVSRRNDQ